MRDRYREHVRAAVLETAHDLIVERGWDRVRMGELADTVGVSRALLYKEFKDKAGLGEAVVLREAARFIDGIEEVLSYHRADAGRGLAAAVDFTLEEAGRSPLLRAVLISNGELSSVSSTGILPLLTTSAQLLELATNSLVTWVTSNFPHLASEEVSDAADALVRLTVSHLALPSWTRPETSHRITEVGLRYLGLSEWSASTAASAAREGSDDVIGSRTSGRGD